MPGLKGLNRTSLSLMSTPWTSPVAAEAGAAAPPDRPADEGQEDGRSRDQPYDGTSWMSMVE